MNDKTNSHATFLLLSHTCRCRYTTLKKAAVHYAHTPNDVSN